MSTEMLLASLVRRNPGLVREALPTVLPWVRFLPPVDANQMADEIVATTEAAVAGNTSPVSQLVTEWRHTAEIHADHNLHRVLAAPSADDFGPVARSTGD